MEVIFEVNKFDTETLDQIKTSISEYESYDTNGLNGTEIVAIVVALTPAVKDLIVSLWPKKTVTFKISNEFGTTEIVANDMKQLDKALNDYLSIVDKVKKSGVIANGDGQVDTKESTT